MLSLLIFLTCLFLVCGVGFLSALSDIRGLNIPNWHSLLIIGAFFVCYGLLRLFGHADVFASLPAHLLGTLIVFLITLAMFALKGLGAADSKLATAYALWVGPGGMIVFLFYMALTGGLLGLAALLIRKYKPFKTPKEGGWVAHLQAGQSKVPYGVAIVCGALASFLKLGYLSPEVLSSFLLS